MGVVIEKVTREDQKVARSSYSKLGASIKGKGKGRKKVYQVRINETKDAIDIPLKALELLQHILAEMAEGRVVTLMPSGSALSTQQAADMLNVSRPHLVKLLEKGVIPFHKAGSHRRIALKDLLVYEKHQKAVARKNLEFLARQAQELKLGY